MECDFYKIACGKVKAISTHTLTWSVTQNKSFSVIPMDISTHTLTWSVTGVGGMTWGDADISTHTLTWSVTNVVVQGANLWDDFNSHAHVERDPEGSTELSNLYTFQLTRSRGA